MLGVGRLIYFAVYAQDQFPQLLVHVVAWPCTVPVPSGVEIIPALAIIPPQMLIS